MWIIAALSGGTGTVIQTLGIQQAKADSDKGVREVAVAFQKQMPVIPKEVKTVIKSNCNSCRSIWMRDIIAHDNQHIMKSH